jgi:hypothetical protein
LNFWAVARHGWHANQQQIAIAFHNPQAVLQAQVLVTHPNGVAIGIGATSTNARKVKIYQEWIDHCGTGAALTPAGTVIGNLLNNQKLVCIAAIGRSDQHQPARI